MAAEHPRTRHFHSRPQWVAKYTTGHGYSAQLWCFTTPTSLAQHGDRTGRTAEWLMHGWIEAMHVHTLIDWVIIHAGSLIAE
jgi:hypothetical protein